MLGFSDVLLTGLARDGGLYMPEQWPPLSASTIAGFAGRPYVEVARSVLSPYLGDEIPADVFDVMLAEAYATFRRPPACCAFASRRRSVRMYSV